MLEHPAHSRLFAAAGLPMPGCRIGDLFTVPVLQAWWGYPMRKATWLCFSRVDVRQLEIPYREHDSRAGLGDRRRQQVMSKNQRAATCEPLAHWLVAAARMSVAGLQSVVADGDDRLANPFRAVRLRSAPPPVRATLDRAPFGAGVVVGGGGAVHVSSVNESPNSR